MTFKDHFSAAASSYAESRPRYPEELAAFLADQSPARDDAWDCGCGSGQISVSLAKHFKRVIATDASPEQLAHATPAPNIEYRVARAEQSGLADHSVDLVVVAQAVHWFDLPRFYDEVRRVARPEAILALITYDLLECDPAVDAVVGDFYKLVGPYWPPERRMVDDQYASLPFPFDEFDAPAFWMRADWDADQLLGYLETWSAVRALEKTAEGRQRFVAFDKDLRRAWGNERPRKPIRWKLSMRIGRCR